MVSGRVQGVGFRRFVFEQAVKLGLKGWVRNLDSGQVEILASGDPQTLLQFQTLVQKGPPRSKVDSLEVNDDTSQVTENSFTIR